MTTELTLLSDDDATHDALVKAFKRFPPIALSQFKRVLNASTKHFAHHLAKQTRIASLNARKRDWQYLVADTDRDVARGAVYSKDQLESYEEAKAKIAQANVEIIALRNEPQIPTINPETPAEFILESRGKFADAHVTVTVPKNGNILDAINASRLDQEDSRRRKAEIHNESLPPQDAIARMVADIDANAQAPDFGSVMRLKPQLLDYVTRTGRGLPDEQGHVEWPTKNAYLEGGRYEEMDQGNRLVCWLFRDALIGRGKAELAKLYAGKKGISVAERTRLLAELDAAILAEERKEEALICMAEDAGLPILRRPMANPLAVLCVAPA